MTEQSTLLGRKVRYTTDGRQGEGTIAAVYSVNHVLCVAVETSDRRVIDQIDSGNIELVETLAEMTRRLMTAAVQSADSLEGLLDELDRSARTK